jgi:cation diffusion facilitator family transporter
MMNLLLSAAKLIIGLKISSRAVMLDAVNGFSDMATSVLSILSTIFGGKRVDRTHPFGYGRLEYITSMFGNVFVIFMAAHAIYDSIRDLIGADASAPNYNTAIIILMAVSLVAKVVYGLLTRNAGKRIRSTALVMSGTETIGDSIVSAAILLNIAIYRITHVNLEPWLSIAISLFIIKACAGLMRECGNKLLGAKGDPQLVHQIKEMVAEEPEVQNVFHLTLHNYGEELCLGSVDIEVDEGMCVTETTRLMRRIRRRAAEKGVRLTSVGIYGTDSRDAEMWDKILEIVRTHQDIQRAYAFSYDDDAKTATFLVALNPDSRAKEHSVDMLENELEKTFPGVDFEIDRIIDL